MEDTDPHFSISFDDTDSMPIPAPESLVRFENTLPGIGGQRLEERVPFKARVETVPLDGRQDPIIGSTEDICHRGLFVRSRERLAVDSLVVLKLNTIHGRLKLTARVVHNIESMGFGCEFIDLSPGQRAALSLLVSTHAGAPRQARTIH
jgi:hypothetical protein